MTTLENMKEARALVDDMAFFLATLGHNAKALTEASASYIMSHAQANGLCDDDDVEACRRVMGDLFHYTGD